MNLFEAALFGLIEGVTEFLPISSTGHLTIVEKLLGYQLDDPDITAFTAIIQMGAVLATLLFLRRDVVRIVPAWLRGLTNRDKRDDDYRFGWAIIIGTLPIAVIGLLFKDQIETTLRSLWYVAFALLLWSAVMYYADRVGKQTRTQKDATWRDTLAIGIVQCLALIPGVSRSGATMSAGLLRGFDRVSVTKLSFFLSVPALLAAGTLQAITKADNISNGVGWPATITATVVSFVVAYLAVTALLKFIAHHSYSVFIVYRVVLAIVLIGLLTTGTISAT